MARLIAFVFCIAFLLAAGGWPRAGMAIAAVGVLGLACYAGALLLGMFLGPSKR